MTDGSHREGDVVRNRARRLAAAAAMVLGVVPVIAGTPAVASAAPSATFSVHRIGTASLSSGELPPSSGPEDASPASGNGKAVANRSPRSNALAARSSSTPSGVVPTATLGISNPSGPDSGFQGIDVYHERYVADGGKQYTYIPPDQALCANGSQVVEGVNDAIAVYDTSGHLQSLKSMNQFYFGDHAVDRSTGVKSTHDVGDPSCVYDAGSGRYFFTVYDLGQDTAGNPTNRSAVDVAVSDSGDATGSWTIYSIDTTNDGSDSTPVHPACPCFGDYPHLGTDANGLYVTTNEFSLASGAFNEALVYAVDKGALTGGSGGPIAGRLFDTYGADTVDGASVPGFTVAPAISDGRSYAPGTMYFLSSDAVFANAGTSKQLVLWSLSGTANLAKASLTTTTVPVPLYAVPPASDQKPGDAPLLECLNDTACSKTLLGSPNRFKESPYALDSSDTRVLSATYVAGKVWGALDTAVDYAGVTRAGVAYAAVGTNGTAAATGTVTVPGENVVYPALGVTPTGRAAMAMTLVGPDDFPSQVVTTFDASHAPASLAVAGAGAGPSDEFGGYRAYGTPRPRWGDYGAATVVGSTVYLANEYVAQSCTLAQYEQPIFGRCGGTRAVLANWSTHITALTP